jgi:hypothetical protein
MPEFSYFPQSFQDNDLEAFGNGLQEFEELPLISLSKEYSQGFRLLVTPTMDSISAGCSVWVRKIDANWWIVHKWRQPTGQRTLVDLENSRLGLKYICEHTILHRAERMLSRREAGTLEILINQLDFFSLPMKDADFLEEQCFDGAIWLLEGIVDHQYHLVCRRDPGFGGQPSNLMKLGYYILALSRETQNSSSPPLQVSLSNAFRESLQDKKIDQAFAFHRMLRRVNSDPQNNTLKEVANILETPEDFDAVLQLIEESREDPFACYPDLAQLAIVVAERGEETQAIFLVKILVDLQAMPDRNVFDSRKIVQAIVRILAIRTCKTKSAFKILSLIKQMFQIAQSSRYLNRSQVVAAIFREIDARKMSKSREVWVWVAVMYSEMKYRLRRWRKLTSEAKGLR